MKKYLPLIITLLVFWSVILYLLILSSGYTGGHLLYTFDDPYIHMAIAKNFITSGTWGITPYEFTCCSSSPLWTSLISFSFLIFGIREIIPLILNVVFASLAAAAAFMFIRRFTQNTFFLTLTLLSLIFFGPFVSVVFTGLEHSMYTMFLVLASLYVFRVQEEPENKKNIYILYILILLLSLSRYEGMFFAFALFLVFLCRKKYISSLLVLAFSFVPLLLLGIIFIAKGWYLFPNSVLLKSPVVLTDPVSFFASILNTRLFALLLEYRRILFLIVLSVIMFFITGKDSTSIKSLLFIFAVTALMNVQFSKLGSLLRYEMHIIVLGILVNVIAILKYSTCKNKFSVYPVTAALLLLMIPFSFSSYRAMRDVPAAMKNIYQMQYQMSEFINRYYSGRTVALNDIGAVNFRGNIHCVDMWGLANKEVAESIRNKCYNSEKIYEINRKNNTDIAIVFDEWFRQFGGIPGKWLCAGSWTIPDNVICGIDKITFYATDSVNFVKLKGNMKLFSGELPVQVIQKGAYLSD
jgi:hypothetical protein